MSETEQNGSAPDQSKPEPSDKEAAQRREPGGRPGRGKPPRDSSGQGVGPAGPRGVPAQRLPLALAVVAIVLGVGVAVTAYFTWREVDRVVDSQQQLASDADTGMARLQDRLSDGARRVDAIQSELDQRLQAARKRQEQEIAALREDQQGVEESVALLRAQMGRSQDGWLLAEAQYLLRIANQRTQLQGDVETALAAMQAADGRLQELSDPGFLPVREALAEEMNALKSVPRVDVAGLALNLADLQQQVPKLRLAGAQYVPAQQRFGDPREDIAASDWRELPKVIWQAIRRLLAIRTQHEPTTPMLPPDQQFFLYQNLQLVLEAAQLALLQGNAGSYRASLETAQRWLGEHFDQDDPATALMDQSLARLAAVDIAPELPDISESLRLLRRQMALMNAADAPRPTPPPVPAATPEPAAETPVEPANAEPPSRPAATLAEDQVEAEVTGAEADAPAADEASDP